MKRIVALFLAVLMLMSTPMEMLASEVSSISVVTETEVEVPEKSESVEGTEVVEEIESVETTESVEETETTEYTEVIEEKEEVEITDVVESNDEITPVFHTGLKDFEITVVPESEMTGEVYDYKELANIDTYSEVYNNEWDKYSSNYFYNQLDEEWKECWDALDALCVSYLESTETIPSDGLGNVALPEAVTVDEGSNFVYKFMYSNPQYYFLLNSFGGATDSEGLLVYVKLKAYGAFLDGTARQTATSAMETQIETMLAEVNVCATDAEKVKKANDLICNKVDYNNGILEGDNTITSEEEAVAFTQSAYSTFCMDLTVCAGYADAMTILCNGAGVDAVSVTSSDHQWNKVRIDDTWYNTDSTWADQDDGIYYGYFFRSDDFYASDNASHIEESFWEGISPECIVDVEPVSPWTEPGTCPTVTNTVETPVISASAFASGYSVTITSSTANADIYYTLDGTNPAVASAKSYKYEGAFELTEVCEIRAIAVCNGYYDSDIVSYIYEGNDGEEGEILTGTLGDNDGFQWSYDTTTKTLTVTGEDSGLYGAVITQNGVKQGISAFYDLGLDIEKLIFQDCTFKESMHRLLTNMKSLKEVRFNNCDTSNVTDMSVMFYGCTSLISIDLTDFNTSNVTNMSTMFRECTSLESLDLSGFDTSNVTNMKLMFAECTSLIDLNLSGFDTSNVTNMEGMFHTCDSLTSLDLSSFDTSNVTNMNTMFAMCQSLINLDLSGFDTSNVTDMGHMFSNDTSLVSLNISNFDTSNVIDMSSMFNACESLISLDLSSFNTSKVTVMDHMFLHCKSLTSLDLSGFDTSNVTSMNFMFQDCSKLKTLNVCKFDTRKVVDMAYMFSLCPSLKSLDLSSFDTSNVQYMNGMFADCSGLTSLDISSFEVSDETQKSSMFNGCRGLTGDLIILDGITRIDDSMYAYCSGFTGDLVIPDGVVSIGNRAFQYCSGLSKAVYLPDSVTSIGTNAFKYGAIILCNSGSYAEEYAIANNYQYGLLDEEYTITYHLNGGENHVDNPTSYTVITDTITLNNPIREGYLFKGWYVDPEFKSQKYTIEKYSSGNIELYAKWNPCVYSIEYYTNGENSSNNPTEYTIETDTIILENPTRKGYEFKGWFLEQEFENQITQIEKGSMGDIALYAKWEAVDYSITYHLNGGINDENNPSTYNATSSTIYLKEPTREGYNFSSWYEDAECTKSIRYILSTRYEDLDLYATWTPISYSVRFHGNGSTDGYMSEVIHLSYEETYTLPANRYEKTGHKFIGWNTKADGTGTWFEDEQEIKNITLKHLENVTLYAQWEAEQFSINYELNGGPNHEENPITYNAMSEDIVLKNPSREGYTFGGWYSDANFKKRVTEIKADSAKDITLYAKWTVHSYTIKFHANSGSGKMSNISTKYDKKVALTNNTFKRKGYEFIGWNTAKDGTGTSYINMEEVANLTTTNKGTVILYAQWKAIDYSITYELNAVGDETVVNPNEEITNYNITTATITLAKPTRDNYTFAGWYSDAKFKKAVTKIAKGSTGNKTLYAKWTPNKYTIKFDKNDPAATGKMSNQKNLAFDKEYTLTKVGFSKKGYNFIGWATEETKNLENLADRVVYTNKDVVKGHTTENGATVILYAVWEEAEYTITYNLNGGTEAIDEEGNPVNPDTYQMDSETIKLAVPTKPGYTFAYWCSDAKLKKKVSDTIKLGSTGNKTFYAKWTANKYTIKFDKSEEEGVTITGSMKNQSMTYGKETALTAVGFKRAGYELAGWTKTKGSQVAEYANKEKVSNLTTEKGGVVTLYAVWKVADYDIIYKNGGTHDNPTSYVLGSTETITLEAPTKEGYDFAGWYSDAKFKKPIKDNKIDLTGKKANITVYAKWTAHKYTIKFDKNVEEDVVVTGTMKDMPNRSYGKSYTLTANTYKRAGYKFLGWSVSADGSTGLIKNKAKVSNLTKLVGKADETEDVVVTLYAQWEIIDYIITYKTGGEVNPNPSTYNVDMEEDINLQNPTREGYTFVGWYTDKNCKKKVSTPAIKAGSTGNKTFYAKWAANKYTITYDQNLGEGAMKVTGTMKDVKNVAYGKTVTLANNTYKRTGYKFLGWSTSADGSTGLIKNKAKVSNLTKQVGKANETENVVVTLYAQWDIIDYTIKYNVNGGILSEEAKTTYTVEDAFTLEDPTMDGYEFVGWYSDAKGTKEVTAIEPGKTGNLTLYAVWKIVN